MKKTQPSRIEVLSSVAPPPVVDEALARHRAMLNNLTSAFDADRMKRISEAIAEKAEKGDSKAQNLVVQMTLSLNRTPAAPTHMQQAIVMQPHGQQSGQQAIYQSDARRNIVLMIEEVGPMPIHEIASRMQMGHAEAAELVSEHPWFGREQKGNRFTWNITGQARSEVFGSERLEMQSAK